ncbi:MAG: glycosyl hydrolase [Cyclobacteriaceae bacterium]
MRFTYLLFSLLVCLNLIAQKRKKATIPQSTSAQSRLEGYEQRKLLESNSLVKNLEFRNVGPTIMSGRVVDIEVNPQDPTHFFVAYASGGLWETKNEGASFTPLFDNEIVMTIGDIAVDWKNDYLYIGTGENNSSRSSYSGFGLFVSKDHGSSWQHLGLEETHHIGRVLIHPKNANTIWVASLGHLYSENEERGVFKSTDGGKTWTKTLYVDNKSGIVELILNPQNPDELIAASWEKDRKAWNFQESGAGSGIFKSTDGGNTWKNISQGENGFPDDLGTGRIGLAYAPSSPNIVYAILDNQSRRETEEKTEQSSLTKDALRSMDSQKFAALKNDEINAFLDNEGFPRDFNAVDLKDGMLNGKYKPIDLVTYQEDANSLLFDTPVKGAEMYRSDNGGASWTKTHEGYIESLVFSYGYYFGQVRVSALDPDMVYTMGVPLIRSNDGGKTWEITSMENVHADHHALWVSSTKKGHLINGNDGGINISYDNGDTWVKCNSTAVGQFYTVNVDMAEPYNVYGGLQDNGVWKGPSNYEYSYSWYEEGKYPYERIMGGDGMYVAIDTRTNELVYTGYQFGNYYRINTKTGERKYITPKHQLGERPLRWNWNSPIILSKHNQDIIYFGSNKFHRSMNQGDDFEALSGDLTKGGKKGDVAYGTISTIDESPTRFGLIYTGSDDGLVHVSKDAGQTWDNISEGLPKDFWISRVVASAHKESRVYVSLNGYRWDNFEALIYQSDDYGKNWRKIGNNLPKEPVNVIKEDPENSQILYIGTDHGAYVSLDRGATFMSFGRSLPKVAVHDLVIHPREKDLIIGTHGRSIYIADVSLLQQLPSELSQSLKVYDIEENTYNKNWGNKPSWHWSGAREPNVGISIFSLMDNEATMQVMKDDLVLFEQKTTLDAGLNFIEYDYSFDADKNTTLSEPVEQAENEKYYLPAGEYQIKVLRKDGTSARGSLIINAPKESPKRKGSE